MTEEREDRHKNDTESRIKFAGKEKDKTGGR